ncbi:glycosyl hydrolase [Caldimonas brevitalea]|uniref:Asl1-like glycosyl hydrolase catalytic domain-containing protein n=1 Tax=Caldimonas brevitalea TaxID=413882 RepID=A0A0G3BJY6_9BURK|nr:glycosyl hydrolase [Caldimonas brevitalea]AKJ28263.1 hypothetical protein AAW51_1572 [Caldimonas brevitalea]
MNKRFLWATGAVALTLAGCGGGAGDTSGGGTATASAVMAAAASTVPLEYLQPGEVKVAESDFNEPFTGYAPGWWINAWGGAQAEASQATGGAAYLGVGGAQKFRITSKGTGDAHLYYEFPFKNGKLYRAVFWLRKDRVNPDLNVEEHPSPVDVLIRQGPAPHTAYAKGAVGATTEWQRVEVEGRYLGTDPAALRVQVRDAGVNIYIDNLTIVEMPDARTAEGTLIPASGSTADTVVDLPQAFSTFDNFTGALAPGWRVNAWPTGAEVTNPTKYTARHESGAQLFQVDQRGADGDAQLYFKYPFRSGRTYRATLRLRSGGDQKVTVMIRRDGLGNYTSVASTTVDLSSTAKTVTLQAAMTDYDPASLRILVEKTGVPVYLEDMKLQEVRKNDVRPATTKTVPPTFFGVHTTKLQDNSLRMATQPTLYRMWDTATTWAHFQPNGEGEWHADAKRRLDFYVTHAQDRGRQVVMVLGQTPAWAQQGGPVGLAYPPTNFEAWRAYVKRLAQEYNGKILYWELWNEADYNKFYKGDVATMVKLAKIAKDELAINPNNKLISPGLTINQGYPWLEKFIELEGDRLVDYIGFHFYFNALRPEEVAAPIANLRDLLKAKGITKPIWNTEGGPRCQPRDTATGGCVADNPTVNEHWAGVSRAMLTMWSQGLENYNYYHWEGIDAYSPTSSLSRPEDGYSKLTIAGQAYERFASREWLRDAKLVDAYEVRDRPEDRHTVYVFHLERGTERFKILWSTDENRLVRLPSTWGVSKATWLDGRTSAVTTQMRIGVVPVKLQ